MPDNFADNFLYRQCIPTEITAWEMAAQIRQKIWQKILRNVPSTVLMMWHVEIYTYRHITFVNSCKKWKMVNSWFMIKKLKMCKMSSYRKVLLVKTTLKSAKTNLFRRIKISWCSNSFYVISDGYSNRWFRSCFNALQCGLDPLLWDRLFCPHILTEDLMGFPHSSKILPRGNTTESLLK